MSLWWRRSSLCFGLGWEARCLCVVCGAGVFARLVLVGAARVGKSSNPVVVVSVVVAAAAAVDVWKAGLGGKSSCWLENKKVTGWCCLRSWEQKSHPRYYYCCCWRAAGYGLLRARRCARCMLALEYWRLLWC